jgi:hypothetical protein
MRFTTLNLSELGKKSNPMFAGTVATVFSNNMAMPKALSFVVLVRSPIDQDGTVGLGKNRVTALLTWKLALLPSVHQKRTEARQACLVAERR